MLVGEPLGLFIANEEGELGSVSSFTAAAAGAELNVAIGLSRLGHQPGYLTKLGRDPFARRIVRTMEESGIDTSLITYDGSRPTGFMLKSRVSAGDPEIHYFRRGSAASELSREDMARLDFGEYGFLHITGIFPALSAAALEAAEYLMRTAREDGLRISFDPNLRPQLWESREKMVETVNHLASLADVVLPGVSEGEILTGRKAPEDIAAFYLSRGAKAVAVKTGGKGAYAATEKDCCTVPGFPVEKVVDTVGAGDGFAVGVISGLAEGLTFSEAVRRGNAIGAIQVMSRGDNEGLPTRTQLEAFMERPHRT